MGVLLRDLRRECLRRGDRREPYGVGTLHVLVEIHARVFEVGELLLEPSHPIAADSYP